MKDDAGFTWEVAQGGYEWVAARPADSPRSAPVPTLVPATTTGIGASRLTRYAPLESATSLFRNFADTWRTRSEILKFANAYGPLGRGVPMQVGGRPATGETLALWQAEISAMRQAVRLWALSKAGDADALADNIRWEEDRAGGVRVVYHSGAARDERGQPHPDEKDAYDQDFQEDFDAAPFAVEAEIASRHAHAEWLERFKPGDVFLPAMVYVQRQVNQRLQELSPPALRYDFARDRMVLQPAPASLLAAMWLQFAEAVSGDKTFHRCRGCFRWFEVAGKGMRSTRFHCSNACRIRAHRLRQECAGQWHADGWTIREIAEELGATVADVKKWVAATEG